MVPNCDFRRKSPFISDWYVKGPQIQWNMKSYVADRSVSVPMTSSDIERQDSGIAIFPEISESTRLQSEGRARF